MGRCQDTNSQPLHKVLLSQCFMIDNLGITVCMECLLYSCTIAWFFVVVIIFFLYVICMMLKIMLSHILRLLCYLLSSLVGLTLPLVGHKISMLRYSLLFSPCPYVIEARDWKSLPDVERLCWEAAVRDCNRYIIETALHYYIEGSALHPKRLRHTTLGRKWFWTYFL